MKKNTLIKAWVVATVCILSISVGIGGFILKGGPSLEYDRQELDKVVESTNRDTRGAAFYRGRKGDYDYFKAQWNLGSKNMKVRISDSPVIDPFNYTSDEKRWRGAGFMGMTGEELSSAIEQKLGTARARS